MVVAKKHFILGMALCIALAAAARTPFAQPQPTPKIATWNLAWMLDKGSFDRWTAVCDSLGWAEGASPKDPTLPYCDVHSGMAWPLRACLRNRAGDEPPRGDSR